MNMIDLLPDSFRSKFSIEQDGCWLWRGGLNSDGYSNNTKQMGSHRFAYITCRGPIPESMVLDHLCRNRACVNPEHLEIVTQRENLMRGDTVAARNASKTHCIRGHEFDADNTMWVRSVGYMKRRCRTCVNQYQRDNRVSRSEMRARKSKPVAA